MNLSARWQKAQQYEKQWWEDRIDVIDTDFYKAYAQDLMAELDGIVEFDENIRILEVGSGAAGIITCLPGNFRYAIDPLEDFYGTVLKFTKNRDPKVRYSTGKGESLQFDDQCMDLVIIDNVLDHCEDVKQVFSEMFRVLVVNGIVYLRLNTYNKWGKFIRFIVELFQIDEGHPYTFSAKNLRILFQDSRFTVIKHKSAGFFNIWLKQIRSKKIKEWAKAVLLAVPDKSLFVLKKQN